MTKKQTATAEPEASTRQHSKPKRQPRYNVILWNDDDHTYDYVIRMMQELFGHDKNRADQIAYTVDRQGRAVCGTTHKEHAELKREQIIAFGRDPLVPQSKGAMRAVIEPAECESDKNQNGQ